VNRSVLSCPICETRTEQEMPTNECVVVFQCPACRSVLRPRPGICCVFCSYGSVKCPSVQCQADRGSVWFPLCLWCQAGAKTSWHTMTHDELCHHESSPFPLAGCYEMAFAARLLISGRSLTTFCYHSATRTGQSIPIHHEDGFSESSVFPWDSSSWVLLDSVESNL